MEEIEIALMVIIALVVVICGFAVIGIAFALFRLLG